MFIFDFFLSSAFRFNSGKQKQPDSKILHYLLETFRLEWRNSTPFSIAIYSEIILCIMSKNLSEIYVFFTFLQRAERISNTHSYKKGCRCILFLVSNFA